jgi:type II secretory pathway component GspD/PulD (secretin)
LLSVIKSLGALTGRNFNIDPQIATDQVTVVMHQKLSPDLAYYVLESILATRGYEMVEMLDGNFIYVVRQGERSQEKRLLILPDQAPPTGYDKIVTVVEPVRYQNAADLQSLLTQARVGSLAGQIDAFENTNTLIITDNLDGVRNILRMLAVLDVPGDAPLVEIFTLEYTRAETLAVQLTDVLVGPDGGGQQADPRVAAQPVARRPPATAQRPGVPGQTEGEVIGHRQEVLRIVHDERLNALITVATEGNMERVRHMINMLDQPTPYEADNMHVYELLNARAENVAEAIN